MPLNIGARQHSCSASSSSCFLMCSLWFITSDNFVFLIYVQLKKNKTKAVPFSLLGEVRREVKHARATRKNIPTRDLSRKPHIRWPSGNFPRVETGTACSPNEQEKGVVTFVVLAGKCVLCRRTSRAHTLHSLAEYTGRGGLWELKQNELEFILNVHTLYQWLCQFGFSFTEPCSCFKTSQSALHRKKVVCQITVSKTESACTFLLIWWFIHGIFFNVTST